MNILHILNKKKYQVSLIDTIPTEVDSMDDILFIDINSIFEEYGEIEKNIHVSWKRKDILDMDFYVIKNGILALKNLNPEYNFQISDNSDVDEYLQKNISSEDYELIKNKHIVEKIDLWRLLKIYNEGGFYMDIDRFYNIPLCEIIKPGVKCIIPTYQNVDFAQDIMISCSGNIFHKRAIELNLQRRRDGWTDILSLGPITYFHAVTEILTGKQMNRKPSDQKFDMLMKIISDSPYLDTYYEIPLYNTVVYRGDEIPFDKDEFYNECNVIHWDVTNPFDRKYVPK